MNVNNTILGFCSIINLDDQYFLLLRHATWFKQCTHELLQCHIKSSIILPIQYYGFRGSISDLGPNPVKHAVVSRGSIFIHG